MQNHICQNYSIMIIKFNNHLLFANYDVDIKRLSFILSDKSISDQLEKMDTIILSFLVGPFSNFNHISITKQSLNDTLKLRCFLNKNINPSISILSIISQLHTLGFHYMFIGPLYDYKYVGNFTGNSNSLLYISKTQPNINSFINLNLSNTKEIIHFITSIKNLSDLDILLNYSYSIIEQNNMDKIKNNEIDRSSLRDPFKNKSSVTHQL